MKQLPRLIVQLITLPALYFLAAIDPVLFQFLVALVLLAMWPVSCAVALTLVLLARVPPRIEALVETADNAVTLALVQTALAGVGLAIVLRALHVIESSVNQIVLVGLAYAVMLLGFPALSWARTLRRVWLPMLREQLHRGPDEPDGAAS